jgi:Fe(3+) dicitrate transport protein
LICVGLVYLWWYKGALLSRVKQAVQERTVHLDVQLMIFNQAWRSLIVAFVATLTWNTGLGVVHVLDDVFGRVSLEWSTFWMMTVYSVVLFVVEDASRFVLHYAMHRVPILWRFHQIHHSATTLTPLTFFRIHPVESALYYGRTILTTGLVAGIFFWMFRESITPFEIMGVPALGYGLNVAFGNIRHSSMFLRFPVWLERWCISPAQHQIHHSIESHHWNRNYGTWLAIWDRWIGSLAISDAAPVAYGLQEPSHEHGLLDALIAPFRPVSFRVVSLAIVVGCVPMMAHAEDASDEDDTQSDAEIIVYGEDEQIQEAGSAHRVDEAVLETFEMNDIQQVLTFVPGVSTRNEDGFGLRPNIGIRGANSDRSAKVTLMEDGVLFAPAPYAAPAAYFFPMTTRLIGIEVFKGAASTRHGPQTVGGAVNLITRSIPVSKTVTSDVSVGGFQTLKGHVSTGGLTQRGVGTLTEIAHLQSDGFKELASGADTGFSRTEMMQKFQFGTKDQVWSVKLGYSREKSHETYLGLSRTDFEQNPLLRYPASQEGLMSWQRSQIELGWKQSREQWTHRVVGYHHFLDRRWQKFNGFASGIDVHNLLLQDPTGGQGALYMSILRGQSDSLMPEEMLIIGSNDRKFHSFGLQQVSVREVNWMQGGHRLEVGARVHGDLVQRTHTEREASMTGGQVVYTDNERVTLLDTHVGAVAASTYIHNDLTIREWHFFPSLRQEVIQTTTDVRGWSDPILRAITLPGMGVLKELNDWTDVFSGVHRGFSPVAPEQPEDVLPEQSWNYEAGIRQHTDMLHVELIGFLNDYQRITGQCTLSSGCNPNDLGKQFTGGRALTSGVESSFNAEWMLPNGWMIPMHGQYAFTHAVFQESFQSGFSQFGSVQSGDALPYVARHQGAISIAIQTEDTNVAIHNAYRGRMLDAADEWLTDASSAIPAIWTTDVALNHQWNADWSGYLTVNNMFNAQQVSSWRPFGSRPNAPRTVFIGVKWSEATDTD